MGRQEFYLHSQIKGFSPRKANKENLTSTFPPFMKGSLAEYQYLTILNW